MVMPLINSLLTRLLARCPYLEVHGPHKLGPYGKMKHCISLYGVTSVGGQSVNGELMRGGIDLMGGDLTLIDYIIN